GNITFCNSAMAKMLEYQVSDLIGKNIFDFLPDDEMKEESIAYFIKLASEKANPETFFGKHRTKTGKIIEVRVDWNYLTNEDGDITGFISVVSDITQITLTLRELLESEERFKLLSDLTFEGIAIHHNDEIIELNQQFAHIFGYKPEELLGKNIFSLTTEDMKAMAYNYRTKNIQTYEATARRKDGSFFIVELHAKPVRYKGKECRFISVRDITERKSAENVIVESEQRFRSLFENMVNAFVHGEFIVDENNQFIDLVINNYNQKFDAIMKPLNINLKGAKLSDLNYDKTEPWFITIVNAYHSNKPVTFDVFSSSLSKHLNITLYFPKKGEFAAMFEDITELKRTEKELNNTIAKLFAMIENTDDYIMIADDKGFPVYFNSNYKKVIEATLGIEMKPGIKPHKLLQNDIEVKYWDQLHERVLSGEKVSVEFPFHFNGLEIIYEFSFFPVFENGQIIGFAEHSRDITAIKLREEELDKARKRAEEGDKLKSAFLTNMSHEIRTPMNAILGFAGLLDNEQLEPEKRKEFIRIINNSANQLLTIISDIVDISKIEAGQLDVSIHNCNVNTIMDDLHSQFSVELNEKNKNHIDFRLQKNPEDNFCEIQTDEIRLKQILSNLLSNAMKFTQEGSIETGYLLKSGKLIREQFPSVFKDHIILMPDKEYLLFYVKDTGIGISIENLTIIFDRFRQEDGSHTRRFGGTGLGLSISKGLAEMLNGKIWVQSIKGQGSQFYFIIPFIPGKVRQIIPEKPVSEWKWNRKKILIVDDEEMIHFYFEEVLEPTGVTCFFASKGNEAIEICRNQDIDLVLLDIQLPDINGYEVVKVMKKEKPGLVVIAQTAYALTGDRAKSLREGCDEYISKPVNRIELFEKMAKFL
ncbi:MAG: PAS domain S-box protein, partial [Bacteroidota bacterium]